MGGYAEMNRDREVAVNGEDETLAQESVADEMSFPDIPTLVINGIHDACCVTNHVAWAQKLRDNWANRTHSCHLYFVELNCNHDTLTALFYTGRWHRAGPLVTQFYNIQGTIPGRSIMPPPTRAILRAVVQPRGFTPTIVHLRKLQPEAKPP